MGVQPCLMPTPTLIPGGKYRPHTLLLSISPKDVDYFLDKSMVDRVIVSNDLNISIADGSLLNRWGLGLIGLHQKCSYPWGISYDGNKFS